MPYQTRCDYIVVNDDLAQAIETTAAIIRHEMVERQLQARQHERTRAISSCAGRAPGARWYPVRLRRPGSAEYAAADQGAILLDRSHEGRILLQGRDQLELVNRMSTNDVSRLALNQGKPTVFINANARILFRAGCFNLPRGLLLISEPGQGEALALICGAAFSIGDQVAVDDISAETAQFACTARPPMR